MPSKQQMRTKVLNMVVIQKSGSDFEMWRIWEGGGKTDRFVWDLVPIQ